MSFLHYPKAWEIAMQEELCSTDRLVLFAVVEHADENGRCFPSQQRLATFTDYSERTVRESLRRLETLEIIHRESRGNGRGGRSSDVITLLFGKAERGSGYSIDQGPNEAKEGVTGISLPRKPEGGSGEPPIGTVKSARDSESGSKATYKVATTYVGESL